MIIHQYLVVVVAPGRLGDSAAGMGKGSTCNLFRKLIRGRWLGFLEEQPKGLMLFLRFFSF